MNPANLVLRFVLEIVALVALGVAGYRWGPPPWSWVWAIGVPLLGALAWGVFNVPGDPSRSGRAPVVVPGWVRLLLELGFFAAAVWAAAAVWGGVVAALFAAAITIHYGWSWGRLRWLLRPYDGDWAADPG